MTGIDGLWFQFLENINGIINTAKVERRKSAAGKFLKKNFEIKQTRNNIDQIRSKLDWLVAYFEKKKKINEQLGSSAQATKGKDPAAQHITKKRGHPILTSQRGEGDRNETYNPVRISTPGQWRLPSGRDEDAGRRGKGGREDAHLDLDRGKAGRRGGEGGGEALRGEDAAGPWNGTMGEGQSGLRPSRWTVDFLFYF